MQGQKLIVPPQLQFVADRLLNSPGRVGTSDNDINSINNQGMLPDGYVVNHYLNDPDAYFIKTDVPDGFKHFVRSPMATSLEGDFDTGNMRYKAREILIRVLKLEMCRRFARSIRAILSFKGPF